MNRNDLERFTAFCAANNNIVFILNQTSLREFAEFVEFCNENFVARGTLTPPLDLLLQAFIFKKFSQC